MFFKKKQNKTKQSLQELLIQTLNAELLDTAPATSSYLQTCTHIVHEVIEFDQITTQKAHLHEQIRQTKHGIAWFQHTFLQYFKTIASNISFETEMDVIDVYLHTYWYFLQTDAAALAETKAQFENIISPILRHLYLKNYNIDIENGMIFNPETEIQNAWKQHFYKASFAFHEGFGDIEICMKEWRIFLAEFHESLCNRPRIIYDFAKEVVAYQKLFYFLSYVIKVEKVNRLKQKLAGKERSAVDSLIHKVINAVYAVDEDYGMILKKLYISL